MNLVTGLLIGSLFNFGSFHHVSTSDVRAYAKVQAAHNLDIVYRTQA